MIKITKKAREAQKQQKRDDQKKGLRIAAEKWNNMTEAQKKAARKWSGNG